MTAIILKICADHWVGSVRLEDTPLIMAQMEDWLGSARLENTPLAMAQMEYRN